MVEAELRTYWKTPWGGLHVQSETQRGSPRWHFAEWMDCRGYFTAAQARKFFERGLRMLDAVEKARWRKCPDCLGTKQQGLGRSSYGAPFRMTSCSKCKGTGKVKEQTK